MDAKDFGANLNKFSEKLIQAFPAINEKAALDAYALMKNRIINEGTIGEEKSLGQYSDNELPTFYFKGKALNSGGDAALKKADADGVGISYKSWRKANNRPTDHVTLSFSGTTFNDIGVVKSLSNGTTILTIVGPKNTKNRDNGKSTSEITSYLKDRYGDFLQPNKEEVAIISKIMDAGINKIIKESLK